MAKSKLICTIPGCGKEHRAKGMCYMHDYYRRKYGDPFGGNTRNGEPARWMAEHMDYAGEDCLIWPFSRSRGYGTIAGPDGWYMHTARYICIRKFGPPPTPTHQAAHNCGKGNIGCVHPGHLRWATPVENSHDKELHGTVMRGSGHYAARLTEDDVRDIRRLWAEGKTGREIGALYGMHYNQAGKIARRTTWKHVV